MHHPNLYPAHDFTDTYKFPELKCQALKICTGKLRQKKTIESTCGFGLIYNKRANRKGDCQIYCPVVEHVKKVLK